ILSFLTPPTTIDRYILSLHDAVPIYEPGESINDHLLFCFVKLSCVLALKSVVPRLLVCWIISSSCHGVVVRYFFSDPFGPIPQEIGRARLNSSHQIISYAVFCLKKKK